MYIKTTDYSVHCRKIIVFLEMFLVISGHTVQDVDKNMSTENPLVLNK